MGEDQLDELELDGCDGLILSFDFNLDQLQDLELDGPITLRILDGIAWDVTQAKGWRWWKTVKCGGLILSCSAGNPYGKAT